MNNVLKKVFDGKFEKLIEIKKNILNNLNIRVADISILYQDFFNYYLYNIISIIIKIIIFTYYIPISSLIMIISVIFIGIIYYFLLKN